MSFYSCGGRSVKRVLHFLYRYCNLDIAEQATVSDGTILYRGKVLATYKWSTKFGEQDVPEFSFVGLQGQTFNTQQLIKCEEAIKECFDSLMPSVDRLLVDPQIVKALHTDLFNSANIRAQIVHKQSPTFFLAKQRSDDNYQKTLFVAAEEQHVVLGDRRPFAYFNAERAKWDKVTGWYRLI